MNANEEAFAVELEQMKQRGEILAYWFESMTFRLAPKTTVTFDFIVVDSDCNVVAYEVKGGKKDGKPFVMEDAHLKYKVFAEKFPHIPLFLTWMHKTYGRKYKEVGDYGESDSLELEIGDEEAR